MSLARYQPTSNCRRVVPLLSALAMTVVFTGCSDDDDGSGGATAAAEATWKSTALVDAEPFCQAAINAEAAAMTEDPAIAAPAFEALVTAAPTDIRPAVDTLVAAASTGNEGSAEFNAAYRELTDWVTDRCQFAVVTMTGSDYAFDGLADSLQAGRTVIELENKGSEFHQVLLLRVHDDVTATLDELIAMPEDELFSNAAPVGGAFAAPGETGTAMIDLRSGRYVAVCLLPVGATPDNMAAIEAGELHSEQHTTKGMRQEFTVS